ncbi:MAG: recombinase family protein, partial [Acidobacteria bacterium]|nr:recombinase family protein [Acidobacteriota bacterium]
MLENFSFKEFEEKKRVGIWVRVSTDLKSQEESPAHHEKRARYYAESKGWIVGAVYSLEGLSGKSVIDYAQTKKMMEDIRTGKITGLIFSKLARLARNTRELLEFSDFFQKHQADMISLDESIDTST